MEASKDQLSLKDITAVFNLQKANQFAVANQPISERRRKLKALKKAVEVTFRSAIQDALYKDMGKPKAEVDLTEIYPVTSEIKHALSHLNSWTRKQRVSTPIGFYGCYFFNTIRAKRSLFNYFTMEFSCKLNDCTSSKCNCGW